MTSFHDDHIRALTQSELQGVVGGASPVPIPPIQGGPIHEPVIPIHPTTPVSGAPVPLPMPVIVV